MIIVLIVTALVVAALFIIHVKVDYQLYFSLDGLRHCVAVRCLFIRKQLDITEHPRIKDINGLGISDYRKILQDALSRSCIKRFEAKAEIGLGDAFITAISCGGLQTAGHVALSYILPANKAHLQKHLRVVPVFERECLDIAMRCILSIKLANIIPVLIHAISTVMHKKKSRAHGGEAKTSA